MAIVGKQVATGAAAKVAGGDADGQEVLVRNGGAASIYLGGDATTSATTGFELKTTDPPQRITIAANEELWAFSAAAQTLHLLVVRSGLA